MKKEIISILKNNVVGVSILGVAVAATGIGAVAGIKANSSKSTAVSAESEYSATEETQSSYKEIVTSNTESQAQPVVSTDVSVPSTESALPMAVVYNKVETATTDNESKEETTPVAEETAAPETVPSEQTTPVEEPTEPTTPAYVNTPNAKYFTYDSVGDGRGIFITSYSGNETDLIVPDHIDGKQVLGIRDDFSGVFALMELKTIKLPEGMEYIGTNVFRSCKKLESVSLPSSLKTISSGAFMNTPSLKYLSLPASITFIDKEALFIEFTDHDKKNRTYGVKSGSYAYNFVSTNGYKYTVE